jgi:ribonucleoside-diphosphate reductase alpha chain
LTLIVKDEIDNQYQSFISKSRYSRWLEEENRRETWKETVDRYVDFMRHTDAGNSLTKTFWKDAHSAILNLEVMPSMRALMTAGPALERENLAQFNCSFIAIDDPRAFDEALYILMNGVGLGFSVESQYVAQLPTVANHHYKTNIVIKVEDTKQGWAKAYRKLIEHLYNGLIPKIDVSAVRPAGSKLKVFGGRASGPQPLVDLFSFTIGTFEAAAGRKLTTLEAHELVCKVGEVVVVGGVRRAALISLSDLGDYDMAKAKSGAWWEGKPHLRLANNSAVYNTKPGIGQFLQEWGHLYDSKSGERGIFNKGFSYSEDSRRDWSQVAGTNPCGEILLRSKGLCNLTEVIVQSEDSLADLKRKVEIATVLGTVQSSLTNFKYIRKIWKDNAEEERLLGVSLTGQFGHEVLSGQSGMSKLASWLDDMREHAVETNRKTAFKAGINASVAITTVKPSGTVSQLTGTASGMHPWHAKEYIRTVRGDNKDPLTEFLKSSGVPHEPDVMAPNDTTVFFFPQQAPDSAVTRDDLTALEHLEMWKVYKQHWTEHNPSVTVSVKEDEWIKVANWLYDNWEWVGGLSFLPYDDHTYKQAPYTDLPAEVDGVIYDSIEEFEKQVPHIEWEYLPYYETQDTTTGSQTLACVAGNCELVSI